MNIKSLRKTRGLPVLQDIRGSTLTMSAPEVLLAHAQVMSEGVVESDTDGDALYHGSTLVTIDLGSEHIEIDVDDRSLEKLAGAARRSLLMHIELIRLARLEAERRCAPMLIREISVETEFRIEGRYLLVDIYVTCSLADVKTLEGSEQGGGA